VGLAAMTRPIIPRDLAARELAISPQVLVRYESLGLVQSIQEGSVEGYEPGQIRRLWTIVSFQRDLGINLAGVEVILQLSDRLSEVNRRVKHLADELREALDADEAASMADSHD
jgi:MerR family transcriptional regulator/heat shock protein HspR